VLFLDFFVALYKSGRAYMSPGAGADWASTPAPGVTFAHMVPLHYLYTTTHQSAFLCQEDIFCDV
jgi:hypothetical protein